MLIQINNIPYLAAPVYVCASNPRNTLSLGTLKSISGFQTASLDVHSAVSLLDRKSNISTISTTVVNKLDFMTLTILTFSDKAKYSMISAQELNHNDRPSMNNVSIVTTSLVLTMKLGNNVQFLSPRNVMSLIATYYVLLF